jgi:hypothetical protein
MSSLFTKYCFSLFASVIASHKDFNLTLNMTSQDWLNSTTKQQMLTTPVFLWTFGGMIAYDIIYYIKGDNSTIDNKNHEVIKKKFMIHEVNLVKYLSNTVPLLSFGIGKMIVTDEEFIQSFMMSFIKAGCVCEIVADAFNWNPKVIIANEINSSDGFAITTDWIP